MPHAVVQKIADALNTRKKAVSGARILIAGVAYKRDIDDLRESPSLEIIRLLQEKGADVVFHDQYCPEIRDDGHTPLHGLPMYSVDLTDAELERSDCVVIVTDHTNVDYDRIARSAGLVVDTRGVMRGRIGGARVLGLSGQGQEPAPGDSTLTAAD
jgi:UDP-N-acetyl-D-glucosamine dehydrogenase